MEVPEHTLDERVLEELKQLLGDWCQAVGGQGATLIQFPEGVVCPCPVPEELSGKPHKTSLLEEGCPLADRDCGREIVAVGTAPPGGVCLTCPLSSGDLLALQVSLPVTSLPPIPTIESRLKLVSKLGAPVLLWAAKVLDPPSEVRDLRRRLREMEERAHTELWQVMRSHEGEREWLALEVHDRVAQTLASIFQQLQTIEGLARASPEVRQVAVRGSLLCREAMREARGLMNDLRPPVLEELGLVPLMEEELQQLEQDTKCKTAFRPIYPLRPSREMELIIYRVFHEALINIRRHAQAKRVAVTLRGDQDGVRLEVRDDGVGFDVGEALARRRIGGLVSMRRRAELAGGQCELESAPGAGTRVVLQTPLTPPPTGGGRLMDGGGQP